MKQTDPMMADGGVKPPPEGTLFSPPAVAKPATLEGNKNAGEECALPTTPCKFCGRPVVWVKVKDHNTGQEQTLPLDPAPPIYIAVHRREEQPGKGNAMRAGKFFDAQGQTRRYGAFILHHVTCREYQEAQKAQGQHGTT